MHPSSKPIRIILQTLSLIFPFLSFVKQTQASTNFSFTLSFTKTDETPLILQTIDSLILQHDFTKAQIKLSQLQSKEGQFVIKDIPLGQYHLTIQLKDYEVAYQTITLCSKCQNKLLVPLVEKNNQSAFPWVSVEEMAMYGDGFTSFSEVFANQFTTKEINEIIAFSRAYSFLLYITQESALSEVQIIPEETPDFIKTKFIQVLQTKGTWRASRINGRNTDGYFKMEVSF